MLYVFEVPVSDLLDATQHSLPLFYDRHVRLLVPAVLVLSPQSVAAEVGCIKIRHFSRDVQFARVVLPTGVRQNSARSPVERVVNIEVAALVVHHSKVEFGRWSGKRRVR